MAQETSGILIVDKPPDMTSARVVSRIKKISGITKIGHTGTLDPMATGVMICTVNRATRLSRFFLESPKKYTAVLRLGIETDTQDATGKVLSERPVDRISVPAVQAAFRRFRGEIDQTPPAYSALKHKGVPLYKYARKGNCVTKPPRKVTIFDIRIIDMDFPDIRFEVACAAGTYVRTLCADIGNMLGCGGHMAALRRTACGGFGIHEALPLEEIESHSSLETLKDRLVSMSGALGAMPSHTADGGLMEKIRYGKPIAAVELNPQGIGAGNSFVKIVDDGDGLLAIVRLDETRDWYNYCCVFYNP